MIATGLSWRMAIGALVLGNAIMGMVITINVRIGARVRLSIACVVDNHSLQFIASHSVSGTCSRAIRLLCQLLRRSIPLRARHHLARVRPLTTHSYSESR